MIDLKIIIIWFSINQQDVTEVYCINLIHVFSSCVTEVSMLVARLTIIDVILRELNANVIVRVVESRRERRRNNNVDWQG